MTKEDLILINLERVEKKLDEQAVTMVVVQTDLSALKVKAGIFGAIAGLIPAMIAWMVSR